MGPLAGRYRLEEVIGRGGMSTVYRATDTVLGRTVAVKILLAGLADEDPDYVARFKREARAAAALRDPAVVAVYDVGVDGERRFIVMEYVDGRSLAALLGGGKPLAVDEAVRVGEQVANALGTAHRHGIVHRDIKPANVMIVGDGTVKVLDFGVARMLDGTTITREASVLGTAAYMAPERALGQPGDARSDIYSLGCLLYVMLTGAPPFRGELAAALLHQHVNATPRPVRELRAEVPAALDALVAEMLAKSPQNRPKSADEVRDRLPAAIDPTAPTIALTPVGPPPAGRLSRRRNVLIGVLGAGAVALIALLLASGGSSPRTGSSTAAHTVGTAHSTPATSRSTPTTTRTATTPTAPTSTAPATPASSTGPPGHHKGPKPGHADKHHGKDKGGGKGHGD
jgi:eukaryotic-like serine/threonine-protein kinase